MILSSNNFRERVPLSANLTDSGAFSRKFLELKKCGLWRTSKSSLMHFFTPDDIPLAVSYLDLEDLLLLLGGGLGL